jgi:hypothetical protein
VAEATSDAVPYLALSAICDVTLAVVWRARASNASRQRAPSSSPSPSASDAG